MSNIKKVVKPAGGCVQVALRGVQHKRAASRRSVPPREHFLDLCLWRLSRSTAVSVTPEGLVELLSVEGMAQDASNQIDLPPAQLWALLWFRSLRAEERRRAIQRNWKTITCRNKRALASAPPKKKRGPKSAKGKKADARAGVTGRLYAEARRVEEAARLLSDALIYSENDGHMMAKGAVRDALDVLLGFEMGSWRKDSDGLERPTLVGGPKPRVPGYGLPKPPATFRRVPPPSTKPNRRLCLNFT